MVFVFCLLFIHLCIVYFALSGRIPSTEDEEGLKLEEVDLEQDTSELDNFLNEPA